MGQWGEIEKPGEWQGQGKLETLPLSLEGLYPFTPVKFKYLSNWVTHEDYPLTKPKLQTDRWPFYAVKDRRAHEQRHSAGSGYKRVGGYLQSPDRLGRRCGGLGGCWALCLHLPSVGCLRARSPRAGSGARLTTSSPKNRMPPSPNLFQKRPSLGATNHILAPKYICVSVTECHRT